MKIIIIIAILISCFACLFKIIFDNNYYQYVKSFWQFNIGIICRFTLVFVLANAFVIL